MKLFLISLIISFLLPGCVTLYSVQAFPESDEPGNLTILRADDSTVAQERFWPSVDGVDVSGIFKNEYVSFNLAGGTHWVGVHCGSSPRQHYQLEVEIDQKRRQYFRIDRRIFGGCKIEQVGEADALEMLKKSIRIKTGHISDCDRKSVLYENMSRSPCSPRVEP